MQECRKRCSQEPFNRCWGWGAFVVGKDWKQTKQADFRYRFEERQNRRFCFLFQVVDLHFLLRSVMNLPVQHLLHAAPVPNFGGTDDWCETC